MATFRQWDRQPRALILESRLACELNSEFTPDLCLGQFPSHGRGCRAQTDNGDFAEWKKKKKKKHSNLEVSRLWILLRTILKSRELFKKSF